MNASLDFILFMCMKIEKELLGVQKNILLKDYTTFKIGGRAKYFFIAKTKEDLIKAIQAAKKLSLPFFILGGGSNLLADDKGFKGLVINFQSSHFNFQKNKIVAGAGLSLGKLVGASAEKGLGGFEWAAGIPGMIGGAIRGNAGAFNKEIKEIVKEVEVFDVKNQKIKIFNNKDCKFKYRDSVFKHTSFCEAKTQCRKDPEAFFERNPNLIILSVEFHLRKEKKSEIQKKIKKHLDYRNKNHPLNFPSAGSVFKNPKTKINLSQKLLKDFPELKEFNKNNLIPIGYLIEKCGLKGKKIGQVKVSEKHCNFIVNLGQGRAKEVITLIKLIKQKVKKKFGIELEEEIVILTYPH